jgi:molecular chaperone IbpA
MWKMRMIDFTPLYRSTIGFDRMFDLLDGLPREPADDGWPPYDIERIGEDHYRITIAVAGFSDENLAVVAAPNGALIEGRRPVEDDQRDFLHHGIARRPFRRQFRLADFVKVSRAALSNGLLTIDLEREVPEAMKPRRVPIATNAAGGDAIDGRRVRDVAELDVRSA